MELRISVHKYLYIHHKLSFLLDIYLGIELLGHRVHICLAIIDLKELSFSPLSPT
jgi:hypothetical protein